MKNTERELATDFTDYTDSKKEIQNKNTERWMPACAGMTADVDNAKVWG